MFDRALLRNVRLREDEEIVRIVRKYLLAFLAPLIVSAVFIIAPFFFLFPLIRLGPFGIILFAILFLVGLFLLLRLILVFSLNAFIITNTRIIDIDQRGMLQKTVSHVELEKIQDISFHVSGLLPTLLHYGDIIIQTAGSQMNVELAHVKDPEKVQELITELRDRNRNRPPVGVNE